MFLQNNGNRIKCYQNAIKATYDTRKSQCLCGLPGLLLSSQKLLILPIKFSRILLRSFAEHYFSPLFTFVAFTCFGSDMHFIRPIGPSFFFFSAPLRPALTVSESGRYSRSCQRTASPVSLRLRDVPLRYSTASCAIASVVRPAPPYVTDCGFGPASVPSTSVFFTGVFFGFFFFFLCSLALTLRESPYKS